MKKVQIEKTAKKFKLVTILCRLAYVGAVAWGIGVYAHADVNGGDSSYAGPAALFAVALGVSVVNRFLTWWSHG